MRGPRISAEIAGIRRRFASLLYESLLLLGVLGAGFMLPLIVLGTAFGWTPPGWLEWLHVVFLLGLYFVLLWRRNGQTLAMQTWRLQIVDSRSGMPPGLKQCLIRYALTWPSLCFFAAGLIWAWFDRDRQFLHDRFSGTIIVLLPGRPGEAGSK